MITTLFTLAFNLTANFVYLLIHTMFIHIISKTALIEKNLLTFSVEVFVGGFYKVKLVAFIFSENLSLFPALTGELLPKFCQSKFLLYMTS